MAPGFHNGHQVQRHSQEKNGEHAAKPQQDQHAKQARKSRKIEAPLVRFVAFDRRQLCLEFINPARAGPESVSAIDIVHANFGNTFVRTITCDGNKKILGGGGVGINTALLPARKVGMPITASCPISNTTWKVVWTYPASISLKSR